MGLGAFRTALVHMRIVIFVTFFGTAAQAWEFQMNGSFTWTHEWYSQQGTNGFFGPYNTDRGTGTRAANLNFWNGGQFDTNITTSASAGWSYLDVDLFPALTINEAIKLSGKYRLGVTFGDPRASDYHTDEAPGVNNAFSQGQWTLFWVTAQTPWGTFGIGKRPWIFGTGLQYDGSDATTTETLALVLPYGPLDIGIAFYPYRFAGSSSIPAYAVDNPYDLPEYPLANGEVVPGQYFSRADQSGSLSSDFLGFVVYHCGPMVAGVLGFRGSYHIGPEALLIDPANPPRFPLVAQDSDFFHGTAYVKYNNGNFFFNAEAAWLYWTDRYHADPNALVSPPNPLDLEQWRYMVQVGAIAGPAMVTLLHAWTPGPDRRNGTLIGKQSAAFVRHAGYDQRLANFDVFRPYSYIFSYDYGSGLNAYNLSGDGYLRDAFVLAARLDYAVAANLSLYASVFYATRTANGYSWGCIGPNAGLGAFSATPDGNIDLNLNRYPTSPNIPDTALGYEIDLGLSWTLLEGWNAGMVLGYWKPGKWFRYACIDRSVPGWETGTAGNFFGTRPDRDIDPVIGGEFSLSFEF